MNNGNTEKCMLILNKSIYWGGQSSIVGLLPVSNAFHNWVVGDLTSISI